MKANDYQKWTKSTVVYKGSQPLIYYTLGLSGETGEFTDKIKKILRDGLPIEGLKATQTELLQELGDCLWYLTRLATTLEIKLEDLMEMNKQKLMDRKKRNKLHGKGDNR